jgi:hypothetical protein
MIAVFLFLCKNGIQAQTTQTELNQVELMKQWIGTWKTEIGKDTFEIQDIRPFGTALEDNITVVTKGKVLNSIKSIWGYDKGTDKIIACAISNSSPEIIIVALWFTSKNICKEVLLQDISNPENATIKWEWEIKSPDLSICTYSENNKVVSVLTYTRDKK